MARRLPSPTLMPLASLVTLPSNSPNLIPLWSLNTCLLIFALS